MTLISAELLKQEFDTWANFYTTKVEEVDYLMRSEAKIVRKGYESNAVDAIIVMANPGSCSAVDKNSQFSPYSSEDKQKEFVAARPDPTQYQLMNLMVRMKWNLLKIINLSDICTGNYKEFKQRLKEFEKISFYSHSIFHVSRSLELNKHLEENSTLIYAWGSDSTIKNLAQLVVDKGLANHGLHHSKNIYYRHPCPRLIEDRTKLLIDMENYLRG